MYTTRWKRQANGAVQRTTRSSSEAPSTIKNTCWTCIRTYQRHTITDILQVVSFIGMTPETKSVGWRNHASHLRYSAKPIIQVALCLKRVAQLFRSYARSEISRCPLRRLTVKFSRSKSHFLREWTKSQKVTELWTQAWGRLGWVLATGVEHSIIELCSCSAVHGRQLWWLVLILNYTTTVLLWSSTPQGPIPVRVECLITLLTHCCFILSVHIVPNLMTGTNGKCT